LPRTFSRGLTLPMVGLLGLGVMSGCAGVRIGAPSNPAIMPARSLPPPGRILAQSIDAPVAHHTAILLGPHNPKDVIELNIGLRVNAPLGATRPITTWARGVGFAVTVITTDQLIAVKAPVARVEQVLRVHINDYRLPGPDGYIFLANDRPPTVPSSLTSIQEISGLSTYLRAHIG